MVTAVVKAKKDTPRSRKKSKRRGTRPPLLEIDSDSGQTVDRIVAAHKENGDKIARPSTRKVPRRRNPAPRQDKEMAKLNELFLNAWEETYESRKRKLS